MKTRFYAGDEGPLEVHFELWGGRHVLDAGDWIDVEFAESDVPSSVTHQPDALVLTQEGAGIMRIWDSQGREVDPAQ